MITLDNTPKQKHNNTFEMSFTGVSSDTKPTGTYDNLKIANGSTFFEMDTQSIAFYNEATNTWV